MHLLICSALSILPYQRTDRELVTVRSEEKGCGRGFPISPISLYLLRRKRGILSGRPVRPESPRLVLLSLGSVLCLAGAGAETSTFENVSAIVSLLGAVLFTAGRDIAKTVLFPAIVLLLPAETYTSPTNPLVPLTAACSAHILRFVGVPVLKEGDLISLPNCPMEVVSACSGMGSLISIAASALLMGYVFLSSKRERLVLVLFSLPAAILGNIVGITATGLSAYYFPSQVSRACLHTTAWLSFLAASLVCLLCFCLIIRWVQRKRMQYLSWLLR